MRMSISLLTLAALAVPAFAGNDARPSVFTSAQAKTGKVAYESTCGLCHLTSLRGRTGGPDELPDTDTLPENYQKTIGSGGQVPALVGEEFMAKWGPKTAGEFAERILEATKGFPPTGNDGKTTFIAVAAYILQANGARPGKQALTTTNPVPVNATVVPRPQKKLQAGVGAGLHPASLEAGGTHS
jgi:hypothetical protein